MTPAAWVRAQSARVPDRVARRALARYANQPLTDRAHVWLRWLSAPFAAVEAELPAAGRILELGCGHGLFASYAALASASRQVVGSDIDADKLVAARAAATGAGDRLQFEHAASGQVPAGPWDAIVILDVLYLLPEPAQQRLLSACAAELAPTGRLLVKEMADTPTWKARWNRTQERLAVQLLGITDHAADGDLTFVPTGRLCTWLQAEGLTTRVLPLDGGRVHPHQLVIATGH